jgi:hypothetical protein
MSHLSGIIQNGALATGNVQSGFHSLDKFSSIIEPLKRFNSISNGIANVLMLILALYVTDLRV